MRRKGQSTLEYAIILAVVIAVIVAVAQGLFKANLTNALNSAATRIQTEAGNL